MSTETSRGTLQGLNRCCEKTVTYQSDLPVERGSIHDRGAILGADVVIEGNEERDRDGYKTENASQYNRGQLKSSLTEVLCRK